MKLFRCDFELDTGTSYISMTKHVFTDDESKCYSILYDDVCHASDESIINLKVKEVYPFNGFVI